MDLMLGVIGGFVLGFAVTSLMLLSSSEDDCGECPYKIYYIQNLASTEVEN